MKTIDVRLNLPDGFDLKIIKISVTNTTQCPFHADMDHFRILDQAAPLAVDMQTLQDVYAAGFRRRSTSHVIAYSPEYLRDMAKDLAPYATQPAVEPVAVYLGNGIIDCGEHGHHNIELLKHIPAGSKLYTQPQPAVAVPQGVSDEWSDAQLKQLAAAYGVTGNIAYASIIRFARALLATHPQPTMLDRVKDAQPPIPASVVDFTNRYRAEPHRSGFWPYKVVCGDGTRELFIGHKTKCMEVAAELQTAFNDGMFAATPPTAPVSATPPEAKVQVGDDSIAHELKTDSPVFEDVLQGRKLFEIRKDDRDYKVGDTLILRETQFTGAQIATGSPLVYTGRETIKRVIGLLRGPAYGLADGWVIMSMATPQPTAATEPEPIHHAVRPTGEQLYMLVTSRFSNGSLPWKMVSKSGKLAWEAAASEVVFEKDTIMARFGNASFDEAVEEIKSLDGWEYADREAIWKLFYEKGLNSKFNQLEK